MLKTFLSIAKASGHLAWMVADLSWARQQAVREFRRELARQGLPAAGIDHLARHYPGLPKLHSKWK